MKKKYQRAHITPEQKVRYRELAQLLKRYPSLKLFAEKTEEEIRYIESGMLPLPSVYQKKAERDGLEAAREAYANEKKRRKRVVDCQIEKIEAALGAVQNQRGAELLELKYLSDLPNLTDEDIIEYMNVSRSTFYRYRNELLSKMSLVYFGKG